MAREQQRGNREKKKPKQPKSKPVAAGSTFIVQPAKTTSGTVKKK